MESAEAQVGKAEIQSRSRRFASLRQAQRALGDALHPEELQRSVEQGREVLSALQELSTRARAEERPPEASDLARVDELLADISLRLRDVVDRVAISELRAALPALAAQQPDTLRSLIEILLEGDLESGKTLRLLEYLVTLLSVEERDLRRTVVCEPSEVTEALRLAADERFDASDPACIAAARFFESATEELAGNEDIGALRDRIRRYKDELGSRLLHPRVLAATVAYNTAMSNRLADLIEGGRTLDRLAEDLMADEAELPTGMPSLGDAPAFDGLVRALRARLAGEEADDPACASIALILDVSGLAPDELEAFEASEADPTCELVCRAVTLGLAVRHRGVIAGDLLALGLDPAALAPHWPRELAREMMSAARKLLASGRYVEASRLLELKTRNLGIAVETNSAGGSRLTTPPRREPAESEAPGVSLSLPLVRQTLSMLAVGLALVLAAVLLWPRTPEMRIYSPGDIAALSAYLHSGHRGLQDGRSRFVGTLNARWDEIDLEARRRVAAEIGARLAEDGVETVLLVDGYRRIQARTADGEVVEVAAPRGAAGE